MTDRTFPKRIVDPILVLDWVSRLLTLYWLLTRLQKVVESRSLLLSAMKAIRWLTIMRYSLPRGRLPASSYSVTLPMNAVGSPFLNLMNNIHLRLGLKSDPKAWYEWKSLLLWSLRWELHSPFIEVRFTLKPVTLTLPF